MSRNKDQFDGTGMAYNILVNHIYTILTAATGAPILNIPVTVLASYLALLTPWNEIYLITKVKTGATTTDRVSRDTAKMLLTNFLRDFVKKYLYDNMPPCTDAIITSLGLKPHATSHNVHGNVPTIKPIFTVKPSENHGFNCKILNDVEMAAKPEGVSIMRIRFFEGAAAPVDPSEFTSFKDYNKVPIVLTLKADAAGQPIAMAACYVNASGDEGPYSNVIVAIIP